MRIAWRRTFGVALAALILVGVAGCGPFGRSVKIDWVNFVRFGGIEYLAQSVALGRAPSEADLGAVYEKVGFKLDGNVGDPSYRPKDGDAAFLDAGTPVYTVKGYAATFRLAAHFAGRLTFYEANSNPNAKTGADLLDIDTKVQSIGVNSEKDGTTQLAAISDPERVAALVALVLASPIDQNRQESGGASYFIAFYLKDGTAVARNYWADSGQLVPGILTPPEFRAAVEQAVHP